MMRRKFDPVWAPMKAEFVKLLPAVNVLPNPNQGELKTGFRTEILVRKWRDWNSQYKEQKIDRKSVV